MKHSNPNNARQMQQLVKSMEHSRRQLAPFREKLLDFTRQYVGMQYSHDGATRKVPINFIELLTGIYVRMLVGGKPRNLITTPHLRLKFQALDFEADQNHLLDEINFELTVQEWVTNAIFLIGIIKTGITEGPQGEIEGFLHDAGQPFADTIDFPDWVHDTNVSRYEQVQFAGNKYYMPADYVFGSGLYGLDGNGQELVGSQHSPYEETGEEKLRNLSGGQEHGIDEFHKLIELWDCWLPREQLVLTFLADDASGVANHKPIRTVEWEGGEEGPYYLLAFTKVPGNMMPLSPVSLMMDLHEMANAVFRKLERQAQRQKDIGIIRPGGENTAEAINKTSDGEWVLNDSPQDARVQKFGGPDPLNSAFFLMAKDLAFSIPGGNIELLGGLSAQSDTLGQDQILNQRASRRLESMQEITWSATEKVMKALAKSNWYDPIRNVKINRKVPGTTLEVPVRHAPELREGDFIDFNFQLYPFSMTNRTPEAKLQTITNYIERVIMPFVEQMREQGLTVDLLQLTRIFSKFSNTPELNELLTTANGPIESDLAEVTGHDKPRQSPVTTRNYVRKNVSTSTRAGRDDVMQRVLTGAASASNNVQQSEVAALGR